MAQSGSSIVILISKLGKGAYRFGDLMAKLGSTSPTCFFQSVGNGGASVEDYRAANAFVCFSSYFFREKHLKA